MMFKNSLKIIMLGTVLSTSLLPLAVCSSMSYHAGPATKTTYVSGLFTSKSFLQRFFRPVLRPDLLVRKHPFITLGAAGLVTFGLVGYYAGLFRSKNVKNVTNVTPKTFYEQGFESMKKKLIYSAVFLYSFINPSAFTDLAQSLNKVVPQTENLKQPQQKIKQETEQKIKQEEKIELKEPAPTTIDYKTVEKLIENYDVETLASFAEKDKSNLTKLFTDVYAKDDTKKIPLLQLSLDHICSTKVANSYQNKEYQFFIRFFKNTKEEIEKKQKDLLNFITTTLGIDLCNFNWYTTNTFEATKVNAINKAVKEQYLPLVNYLLEHYPNILYENNNKLKLTLDFNDIFTNNFTFAYSTITNEIIDQNITVFDTTTGTPAIGYFPCFAAIIDKLTKDKVNPRVSTLLLFGNNRCPFVASFFYLLGDLQNKFANDFTLNSICNIILKLYKQNDDFIVPPASTMDFKAIDSNDVETFRDFVKKGIEIFKQSEIFKKIIDNTGIVKKLENALEALAVNTSLYEIIKDYVIRTDFDEIKILAQQDNKELTKIITKKSPDDQLPLFQIVLLPMKNTTENSPHLNKIKQTIPGTFILQLYENKKDIQNQLTFLDSITKQFFINLGAFDWYDSASDIIKNTNALNEALSMQQLPLIKHLLTNHSSILYDKQNRLTLDLERIFTINPGLTKVFVIQDKSEFSKELVNNKLTLTQIEPYTTATYQNHDARDVPAIGLFPCLSEVIDYLITNKAKLGKTTLPIFKTSRCSIIARLLCCFHKMTNVDNLERLNYIAICEAILKLYAANGSKLGNITELASENTEEQKTFKKHLAKGLKNLQFYINGKLGKKSKKEVLKGRPLLKDNKDDGELNKQIKTQLEMLESQGITTVKQASFELNLDQFKIDAESYTKLTKIIKLTDEKTWNTYFSQAVKKTKESTRFRNLLFPEGFQSGDVQFKEEYGQISINKTYYNEHIENSFNKFAKPYNQFVSMFFAKTIDKPKLFKIELTGEDHMISLLDSILNTPRISILKSYLDSEANETLNGFYFFKTKTLKLNLLYNLDDNAFKLKCFPEDLSATDADRTFFSYSEFIHLFGMYPCLMLLLNHIAKLDKSIKNLLDIKISMRKDDAVLFSCPIIAALLYGGQNRSDMVEGHSIYEVVLELFIKNEKEFGSINLIDAAKLDINAQQDFYGELLSGLKSLKKYTENNYTNYIQPEEPKGDYTSSLNNAIKHYSLGTDDLSKQELIKLQKIKAYNTKYREQRTAALGTTVLAKIEQLIMQAKDEIKKLKSSKKTDSNLKQKNKKPKKKLTLEEKKKRE